MKTRQAFVANSSSSSFLIPLEALTGSQIFKIKEHIQSAQDMDNIDYKNEDDAWNVYQNETHLVGFTHINNFDMEQFFENIEVNEEDVIWDTFPERF